jgi:toxin ParE1/3/4
VTGYRLTADAQLDLNAIADFIIRENPARAVTFIDELIDHFRTIAERPKSFPARDNLVPGLRSAVHGKYLILFRIEDDFVRILRVVHGARDLPRLLRDHKA